MPFEKSLIEYCSPTLASLKVANLFNYKYATETELEENITYWNAQMAVKGIQMIILRRREQKALIYVCRLSELERTLKDVHIMQFLRSCGYEGRDIEAVIKHLKKRLASSDEFPHEIGIFLGYPLEDVLGFIHNTGKNFQLCGTWKVYGDQENAQRQFIKFKKCTDIYLRLWNSGRSIWQLTVAA